MAEESILTDDFLRELINVGEVDILVGVPTYNDARTVGPVIGQEPCFKHLDLAYQSYPLQGDVVAA